MICGALGRRKNYRKKEEIAPPEFVMALNIKNAEAERLARELARRRGRPALDHRSADEILGYNELGHFD
jgi:putative transcription factor